ncbi:MAG: hypothetical protein SFY68_14735 [Candidatus Sumerlaeia bacterium]|nr:hypothetical protein [Candidatus Sumerlaeia bacterium]
MIPFLLAFLLGAILVAVCQRILPATRGRRLHREEGERPRVGHGLWFGLMAATALLAAVQPMLIHEGAALRFGFGPSLWNILPAALPLLLLALRSDFRRPSSERHLLGLLLSGGLLAVGGFGISLLSNPLQGTIGLNPLLAVAFSVVWLLILASLFELIRLVPYGVGLVVGLLCVVLCVMGGLQQSVAAGLLMGLVPGAVLGRWLGVVMLQAKGEYGRAEILTLGFFATAMLNISFMKSIALAGLVLPMGIVCIAIILISLRGFERSLILRNAPSAERTVAPMPRR